MQQIRFLMNGMTDTLESLAPYNIATIQQSREYDLSIRPRLLHSKLMINSQDPALSDKRVRKALYLATDQVRIAGIISPAFTPVYGLIPPMPGYKGMAPAHPVEERIEIARQLMSEAGYSESNLLDLVVSRGNTGRKTSTAQLVRMWRKIFVKVSFRDLPGKELYASQHAGDFQVARHIWAVDIPDPQSFLDIYTNGYAPAIFPARDEVLQSFFDQAGNAPDTESRYRILREAEKHLLDQYYAVPLYSNPVFSAVTNSIRGWSAAPLALNSSRWLCKEPCATNADSGDDGN